MYKRINKKKLVKFISIAVVTSCIFTINDMKIVDGIEHQNNITENRVLNKWVKEDGKWYQTNG